MRGVGGTEAEVNQIHRLFPAPHECLQQALNYGAQPLIEYFNGVEVCLRRPLADGTGYRGPVSETIDRVALAGERDGAGQGSDMDMAGADPAIHNRDLEPAIGYTAIE